jgi:hypothetical protein
MEATTKSPTEADHFKEDKSMSHEREELLFCKLDEVFEPKENMSPYGLRDKWRIVPVTTEEYSGNMLYAAYHNEADLTFSRDCRAGIRSICISPRAGSISS